MSHMGPFLTAGTIVAFTTLQSRLYFPIGQLLRLPVEIQSALALFDRIFEYLDMPTEIKDAPHAISLIPEETQGRLTFKDVTFTYKRDISGMESEVEEKMIKQAGKIRYSGLLD